MWFDYLFYGFVPYAVAAVFLTGLFFRLRGWAGTPVPLKIPLTPAPETRFRLLPRLAGRFVLFLDLHRHDPLLWASAWVFHLSLVLVLLAHLRFFLLPVPGWALFFPDPGRVALFPLLFLARFLFSGFGFEPDDGRFSLRWGPVWRSGSGRVLDTQPQAACYCAGDYNGYKCLFHDPWKLAVLGSGIKIVVDYRPCPG